MILSKYELNKLTARRFYGSKVGIELLLDEIDGVTIGAEQDQGSSK